MEKEDFVLLLQVADEVDRFSNFSEAEEAPAAETYENEEADEDDNEGEDLFGDNLTRWILNNWIKIFKPHTITAIV